MPKTQEQTSQLVEMLVRSLVDNQDGVSVLSMPSANESDGLLIEISVDGEEAGKVIGRQGKTIKAIRTLARAQADFLVDVEVVD